MKHYKIILRNLSFPLLYSLFSFLPGQAIRKFLLKWYGAKIGKNGKISRNVTIMSPWNLVIGENVVINEDVVLDARGGINIGNHVDIARGSYIWSGQHDYNDNTHKYVTNPVIIEDYVWIASRATVLPGVKIRKGAVVASCALVSKDVESMSVVGGVPAKQIAVRKNELNYTLKTR